jgi:hypothetical protein
MRWSHFAVIGVVGLALLLLVREASHSHQLQTLRVEREELLAQNQSLAERLDGVESRFNRAHETAQSDVILNQAAISDPQLSARVTELENQLRALQAQFSIDYDPTLAAEPEAEMETNASPARAWGPEQVTGPPDTDREGDARTAWATAEMDAGPEWLTVRFGRAVEIKQVRVRENYNPGAITNVSAVVNGAEMTLWQGHAARGRGLRNFLASAPAGIYADTIIIHLDTKRASGWNEIDAVELVGRDGSRQWAASASASSSYAERTVSRPYLQFQPRSE